MSNFREVVKFRPFLEVKKKFKVLEHKHIIYRFEAGDLEIPNLFREKFSFRGFTKAF